MLNLDEEHLGCLVSPQRKELLSAFLLSGPCGVAEIADGLGRPVKSLYYHVREMLRAGLIREVGSRGEGRDRETLFDAAAERYHLRQNTRDAGYRRQEIRSVLAMLRLASREYQRAAENESETLVLRISTRLSLEDYQEVKERFREVIEFAKSRDDAEHGSPMMITAIAAAKLKASLPLERVPDTRKPPPNGIRRRRTKQG